MYKHPALLAFLQKKQVRAAGIDELGQGPARFTVLCVQAAALSSPQEIEAVGGFVRKGGGLVTGSLGWGWLQLHPGKDLRTDHPGNVLLAPVGIVWADGTLARTCDVGYTAGKPPSRLVHAARALDALESHAPLAKDDLAQAAWVVTHAARALPSTDKLLLPNHRTISARTPSKPADTRKARPNSLQLLNPMIRPVSSTVSMYAKSLWSGPSPSPPRTQSGKPAAASRPAHASTSSAKNARCCTSGRPSGSRLCR